MATKDTDEQDSPGELEDLFDAPVAGADDPFSSWGAAPGPSASPAPAARPVHPVPAVVPVAPRQAAVAPIEEQGSDDAEARNGQSGFRVSQEVADRLKEYRQSNDLTVTEVVIEALDYVAEDVPGVMARAKMPARVTPKRSRFAARGSKGPLKGTGPVQRWWQPTKGDKHVLLEMAVEASVRDSPGVLIAVALNEFLPGGAMYIAGQLRPQIEADPEFQVPSELTLSRTYSVTREIARQGLVQLQIEGLIPVD
ncbi:MULTISPECIES: hypothetical protein [unclassified Streptomyces]|uniref:hypothetical protein n=1 Tax=unclassified Streptomyces TaxID=2593676 RepID=UPI001EEFCEDE|nr:MULTISPECIES: hypothetical protein [unclassified Streptomyces]